MILIVHVGKPSLRKVRQLDTQLLSVGLGLDHRILGHPIAESTFCAMCSAPGKQPIKKHSSYNCGQDEI